MQVHLAACASAPHRAILGLLPVALGLPAREGLHQDLAHSDAGELVAIASAHLIHPLLATAFAEDPSLKECVPDDLCLFLQEIQYANARRNEAILAQVRSLGSMTEALGLTAVALKGAAELISPLYPAAGARMLSDVDVLLTPEDALTLRQALLARGATQEEADHHKWVDHHHFPPLFLEGWPAPVELHRQAAPGYAGNIVDSKQVLAEAVTDSASNLGVPSTHWRLIHVIAHWQLSDPERFSGRPISLRDAVDLHLLRRQLAPEAIAAIQERFDRAGHRRAFENSIALAARLFDPDSKQKNAWADGALRVFGSPGVARWRFDLYTLKFHARDFLRDRERRRHYLKLLSNWRLLSAALRRQSSRRDGFR
ncbi:nucleotidyltransferase family protein [Tropicimonas marinistellae]|uniref:nucleotidyltransferase family protein n=1 Tax=Tropicimonas marinistellae TaxID=1739787 RepID=UPI0008297995|nr:nucleotidyltransferase family protein [Tropicimonas marinistellae]